MKQPNVVVVVLDDLGFAQLGAFGAGIETPNIDRLANGGLRYNRFHVTSLCSPTRACLLTGRNHHAVGMGMVPEYRTDLPGYSGVIPPSAGTLPRHLRDAGYSTLAVGKWHLVPLGERTQAGPFHNWPLGKGFERYYGFITAAEDQWTPRLQSDNTFVDPPATPAEGYHLSEDLADRAVRMLQEQQHGAPGRPFFLYLAFGAPHQPHQVPPAWIERYRGRFDAGWDVEREQVFARQQAMGVVPPDTTLTERPPALRAWDDCSPDERRLFARMQEVFAAFVSHTDAQIGRVLDRLEELDVLDDTIVLLLSDNGASAEAGPLGSFNYHRHYDGLHEDLASMLPRLDDLGGHESSGHYPWTWAWAGNTPFRLWKRYTWLGGTRTPLVVHWPNGIAARGEIRSQFAHAVDLMPTLLDVCGVRPAAALDGIEQQPFDGASLRPTFDDAGAPSPRQDQYFEVFGSRSIVSGRWKATTDHVTDAFYDRAMLEGSSDFADDRWQLFDLEADFSEADDVADRHPEVVRRLEELWLAEAERNHVLPMMDSLAEIRTRASAVSRPAERLTFRPGAGLLLGDSIPPLHGGFALLADVEIPVGGAEGVLAQIGDWHSGIALFVRAGRLTLAVSATGDVVEQASDVELAPGRSTIGCVYRVDAGVGTFSLLEQGREIGVVTLERPLGRTSLARQHLSVGLGWGFPVTRSYESPFPWTGVLHHLTLDASASPSIEPADVQAVLQGD